MMGSLRLFLIFLSLAMIALALPAFAQEKVAARTGLHSGYTRLVFEWGEKPSYSLSKEGGRLLIRFAKAGTVDTAGISSGDKNVKGIDTLSKGSEPLQIAVAIPDGSRFRDFVVENKLIVDIYDTDKAEASKPTAEKPAEKTVKQAEEAPSPKVEEKAEEKPAGDFTIKPGPVEEAAPIYPVEAAKVDAPAIEPHVITMTSMYSVGMAAFTRAGNLWIVLDAPDLPLEPKLTGPQVSRFSKLEKVAVEGGAAYRMEIPDGLNVYADGGGLSWKITLTSQKREIKPAAPSAQVENGQAKLVWPLQGMRKVLNIPDPVVGDIVTAVTSGTSKQYAGPGRSFVNLQSLDSVVGLAYAPRTDDLKTELTTQQVIVGSVNGLSLSNAPPPVATPLKEEKKPEEDMSLKDAPPPAIPEHVEAAVENKISTAEMASAAGEKPSGNNIYNFPRWEMGGIQALDQNQHVMMVDVSAKPEESRAEDIITMAKMNIANNRGPEALGLLRVALYKVPELEENTEFQSLRAAALALSNKYDEAIIDFSRETLAKYDDVKYWRAFSLAGLEDWKQAIDVMPTNFEQIYTYPKEIRTPMLLTFAEIALRGGKVPLAQGILKKLEPELAKMPLAYASSYKYLLGETQRQSGNPAKAEETWTPLVKDGKDDLFRAKAGLSLTKLQLDEKKIKPAEAIDRLEGLRYAWRGDELETLINYRLGQVYVDNKDYLKGLTVWRNASSFSPGTAIAENVKVAMNNSFRDVFANDRLKDVGPLEAISLYEEFKDLTPPGDEGNKVVEKLAERLVDADLLGRAAALLEYHVNNRLTGDKKAGIAIRLAAIRLLDGNPDGAMRSLEIAEDALNRLETGVAEPPKSGQPVTESVPVTTGVKADPEKRRQINLLRARALSMQKKPDEAIAILEDMRLDPDVNKLRTDIAWTAGKWEEAAMALNDLIVAEDISPKMPLTDYQRDIILNRAIALNLSGNRVALANLRERHNTQMKGTTKGQMFEVVTRARRPDMIGSREAITSMISEIDLFKGFLEGYGKMQDASKPGAPKEPSAPKEPAPVNGKAVAPAADAKPAEATPETKPAAEVAAPSQ
jgi:predicted negative regulator of RcsB-dependent stress response